MNEKIPKIRFKGFTDVWEQRKLSEIVNMHARIGWQNLRKDEFLDSGEYLLVTGTDFDNGSINYDTCHYVEKERYVQDKNIQIENGSILVTKDGTLGKVAFVRNLPIPATLNAGVFNITNNKILSDNKYLYQYLKAPFLMNYVTQNATGGTIKHLNQNILVNFPVSMPNVIEQNKVGELLNCIDNLITLHQRKCEKLQNIKKSLLEKMFPKNNEIIPEIRFKGFTDVWEQRKLLEVANYRNGKAHENEIDENGKYIVVNSKFVSTEGKVRKFSNKQNEPLLKNEIAFVLSDVPNGKAIAKTFLVDKSDKYTLNQRIAGITPFEYINPKYLSITMNRNKYFLQFDDGVKQTNLSLSDMLKYENYYPIKEEQDKIGLLFTKLDNLITLHQRKLEKLQNVKKSLLEKMFV